IELISANGTRAPPARNSTASERKSCPSSVSFTGRQTLNVGRNNDPPTSAFGKASRRRLTAVPRLDASEDVGSPITLGQSRTTMGFSLRSNNRERYARPPNSIEQKPS